MLANETSVCCGSGCCWKQLRSTCNSYFVRTGISCVLDGGFDILAGDSLSSVSLRLEFADFDIAAPNTHIHDPELRN